MAEGEGEENGGGEDGDKAAAAKAKESRDGSGDVVELRCCEGGEGLEECGLGGGVWIVV